MAAPRKAAPAEVAPPSSMLEPPTQLFEDQVLAALSALSSASERVESEVRAVAAALRRLGPAQGPGASEEGPDAAGSPERGWQSVETPPTSDEPTKPEDTELDHFIAPWLPQGWPVALRRRQVFHAAPRISAASCMLKDADATLTSIPSLQPGSGHVRPLLRRAYTWTWLRVPRQAFINPNSKSHMTYGIISMLVIMFEITALPFVLAWDVSLAGWLQILAWGTPFFWTVDIGVHFCTGTYRHGELCMQWKAVALNYCRTWLALDLVVVAFDWASLAIGLSSEGATDAQRFTKLGRVFRIVGIMRLVRVIRTVEEIIDMWLSEALRLACRVGGIFLSVMWGAHVLSCVWFFVGTQSEVSDTGASWLEGAAVEVQGEPLGLLDTSLPYQYLVCLHWAVSLISLCGAIDTMPRNAVERLMFVFATMMGFLFGSMIVSLMSAGIIDFVLSKKDKLFKMRTLRRYLAENNANHHIATMVTKQIEQRLSIQDKVDEHDVPALKLLSPAVLSQLRFDLSKSCFECHPYFRMFISFDARGMQRVCDEAALARHVRERDELFSAGAEGVAAFVVSHGRLLYTHELSTEASSGVGVGAWVSEAALWVEWTHTGRLESVTEARVVRIDAEKLFRALHHPTFRAIAAEYAVQFHKRVVSAKPSDLVVPRTDYCELVCAMSPAVQVQIGLGALRQLSASEGGLMTSARLEKLKQEIVSGRSVLVVAGDGSVRRAVSLVVLRLVNSDGWLFVQLGKISDAGYEPCCQLPGMKQLPPEAVGETLERLIESKLSTLLAGKLELSEVSEQTAEKESQALGVPTRYLRLVVAASISAGQAIDAPVIAYRGAGSEDSSGLPFGESTKPSSAHVFHELFERDVWAVPRVQEPGSRSWDCYAWVSPEEFAFLTGGSRGESLLTYWLSLLMPPKAAPADEDSPSETFSL